MNRADYTLLRKRRSFERRVREEQQHIQEARENIWAHQKQLYSAECDLAAFDADHPDARALSEEEDAVARRESGGSEQPGRSADPFQVGDLIRYRGGKNGRNRGRPREVIRVLPSQIETMALDGNGRNSTIDRRRLSLYELVRAAS